ncbi:MAG: hypothetical protein NC095_06410 [Muribaculum sp.]|nr:hypothetical protein [Muribaculum sp.]
MDFIDFDSNAFGGSELAVDKNVFMAEDSAPDSCAMWVKEWRLMRIDNGFAISAFSAIFLRCWMVMFSILKS